MYSVGLKKDCTAKHYLSNHEDKEGEVHSHNYVIEIIISGERTNDEGYLINIDKVEKISTSLIEKFEGKVLNDLSEFENINPTLENFSKIVWKRIKKKINPENASHLKIKIFETEDAYASYGGKIRD